MIVFDLTCDEGHRFEGWFGSSGDYEDQLERGLLVCPHCGSAQVSKAPMAPAVPAKGNAVVQTPAQPAAQDVAPVANREMPAEVQQAMEKLAQVQAKALKSSTNVGGDFVKQSREMHYGERKEAPIHGQASLKEAKALVDEGVPVAPLPFPVAPPEKLN
ncbi:MAG: DUF1178 family protein [Pseudomonadota bacterium]